MSIPLRLADSLKPLMIRPFTGHVHSSWSSAGSPAGAPAPGDAAGVAGLPSVDELADARGPIGAAAPEAGTGLDTLELPALPAPPAPALAAEAPDPLPPPCACSCATAASEYGNRTAF